MREPTWWELLEVEWQAEWACIEADWLRVQRDLEIEETRGGERDGTGQPDVQREAERPPGWPDGGSVEG